MDALVIGFGSIGERHARILEEIGCRVGVVSSREIERYSCYKSIEAALDDRNAGYVVIANPTADHYPALHELARLAYDGKVLVEKPLFAEKRLLPDNKFQAVAVAYNLRFHPVIRRLKQLLANERTISVQVYVGQYLPTWRPGTDYRASYSAHKGRGGGVLRDLSHELDYVSWIFGQWKRLAAIGGQYSELQIDSEDAFALLMETEKCPLMTVQINYLDRAPRREIVVNTQALTCKADLITGTVELDGITESIAAERDVTYRLQHQALMSGQLEHLCSVNDALKLLELIAAAERAAEMGRWMTNE